MSEQDARTAVPSTEQREQWLDAAFVVCLLVSTFGGLIMLGIGIGYMIWGQA